MQRRTFLKAAGLLGVGLGAYQLRHYWPDTGLYNPCHTTLPDDLVNHPLMQTIWDGLDPSQVWDNHVHIVGTGDNNTGVWVNPNMARWSHPILKIQKSFYENGACADPEKIDLSTVERMVSLSQSMPVGYKSMLFAFEWFHDAQGKPIKDNSIFHIPNAYAYKLAQSYPQYFEWVASIHPYRADAVDTLEAAKEKGARAIKWLPPAMGIDPASPKCDAFYKKAAEINMPIISHTGAEAAVQGGDQNHGNPLRLRRAFDQGVKVIMAHCASHGEDEDMDNGNKRVNSYELFARLMDTADYERVAFGEISAITLINHSWAIPRVLERTDWHHRIVNGSDYPLPAIMPLINTKQLLNMNLLDSEHLPFLQKLKAYHPLMFDFALKRLMRYQGQHFPNQIFETRKVFAPESIG